MSRINTFTEESIRRVARETYAAERDALRSLFFLPPVLPERPKWVAFRNTSGEEIPAYGVMRVTGAELKAGLPLITVAKPSTAFQRLYLVNGPTRVGSEAQARGVGTWLTDDLGGYVLYESGTPAYGESWGPKAGQWSLAKWRYGFTIVGGLAGTGAGIRVVAKQEPVNAFIGVTDSSVSKGSTGTISIYDGNDADTSDNMASVANRYADVGSGKKVDVSWRGGKWYMTAAEC